VSHQHPAVTHQHPAVTMGLVSEFSTLPIVIWESDSSIELLYDMHIWFQKAYRMPAAQPGTPVLGTHGSQAKKCNENGPLFFFFLEILEFELRTLHLYSYHLSHDTSPFCFSYFSDRSLCFCLGLASDCEPSTSASSIAGITGVPYHIQLVN
jgi:hypothetical protein